MPFAPATDQLSRHVTLIWSKFTSSSRVEHRLQCRLIGSGSVWQGIQPICLDQTAAGAQQEAASSRSSPAFRCTGHWSLTVTGATGEVCKRLDAAGVRGRTLTLKLKRRKAGAPEPPKFMGHGSCDNLSRSMTLTRFTANPGEVAAAARNLLRALRVPAPEIRGIGIAVRLWLVMGGRRR